MSKHEIIVVGEQPQINPRAKAILTEALKEAGIKEKKYKWINVLEESPPEGKNVTKTMIKNARESFLSKLEKKDPKYVLLLGNTPCQALLETSGIRSLRGKPIEKDGRVVLPILHPNQALHDDKWVDIIESDIARLKECIKFGGIPEEKSLDFHVVDTWAKVKKMLADLKKTVSVDLETTRLYPFTTQLDKLVESGRASQAAIADHKAYHNGNLPKVVAMQFGCKKRQWVVPMETAGIWSKKDLAKIVRLVTKKLKRCLTVYHNGKFDALWMLVRFGVKWTVRFDTMLAHYMLDENDFHGLKYLAQKYFGVPDWDVAGGVKTTWSNQNAKYAAHDVFYTRKLYYSLLKELKDDREVKQVYDLVMIPCIKLFVEAEFTGVQINEANMDDAEAYLREELAKAEAALDKWGSKATLVDKKTGKINWGSTQQLGNLLFKDLKIKSTVKTKTGAASTSESALNQIDHPMVADLLKFRGHKQQLSFFIEGWKPYLDLEGRLHPSFKLHGTVTGRLSCENPNLQQVPRDPRIRTLITAPEGWTLMEMDLSQIELRIAAELADEHNLLRVFNEGGDPHWQTAIREIERGAGYKKEVIKTAKLHSGKKMKYGDAIEYILGIGGDEAKRVMEEWTETKQLKKALIDWGETRKKAKAINFGYLYGMWWKKFKIYARDNYGVTVTDPEAQASREAFFELYPAFLKWHKRQQRFAQVNGYVRSLSGRKRRLPAATGGRDTPERREAQRQAINSPVQSFANELNLMAAIQMRREFRSSWFRIVGTVHDAILMWVRNDKLEEVHNRGLQIMSQPDLLEDFEIKMGVPIEAEAKIGPWGKGVSIEKWLKAQNDNQPSSTQRSKKAKKKAA